MSFQDFVDGYIACALWSSTDDADAPLDPTYGAEDIAPDSLDEMAADCRAFYETNRADIIRTRDFGRDDAACGHDFWLTRNGHGAGFWDRGMGAVGDRLTASAKAYGGATLYIGDNGRLHVS